MLSFCFPISFVILLFVLGWPLMLFGELLPESVLKIFSGPNEGDLSLKIVIPGLIIDMLILYFAGHLKDKKDRIDVPYFKRRALRWPLVFLAICIFLSVLMFVDPTCV